MSIVSISEARDYMRAEQFIDEALLTNALNTAHAVFYDMCQRSFEVAGAATARLYVPSGSNVLRIHDCTSVTAVTASGSAVSAGTYQKEPTTVSWSGETRPYEQLRRLGYYWWDVTGYPGETTISVTATWGWAATPPAAIEAVKALCKDIATNRDVRAGFLSFGDAGVAAARNNRFVADTASRYGRVERFGIA